MALYRVGQGKGVGVPVQLGPSGRSLNMPRGCPYIVRSDASWVMLTCDPHPVNRMKDRHN